MPKGRNISIDIKERIVSAYKSGIKQCEISRRLSVTKSVVSKTIANFKRRGMVFNRKSPGRPRKTSRRDDKRIKRLAMVDPFKPATKIKAELDVIHVSTRTIQRRLTEANFSVCRPAKKPLLSKKNIEARMLFARRHEHWTVRDWKKVLFSDESKYSIFGSDGIRYVRRPKHERLNPKYVLPTVKHGGGSVMVWGCFSGYGMGPIHRIEGIMDRYKYATILEDIMLPYAEWNMPLRFIFQQDNDPKHTSKFVKEWFTSHKVNVLKWPAQSPDLNPIENLWEIVEKKIRSKTFANATQLMEEIQIVWNSMDQDIIDNLIASMPKRCKEVINNKGYWTKY